jgi:hypothetical protein
VRLEVFAKRVYFSRLVPSRLREADLDRRTRRAGRSVLSHPTPPATYSEKVRYKLLHDRNPLLVQWADKFASRDYIAAKVGNDLLPRLYLVTEDPEAIRRDALPREFALKATHGWGGVVIVGDHVSPERSLPAPPAGWVALDVAPDNVDWERLRGLCREWLHRRYRPAIEWPYRHIQPRILVEEPLVDRGAVAPDYKVFVFHGRARLIGVHLARYTRHTRTYYSPEWERLPVRLGDVPSGPTIEKPASLAEMIRISEALSQETDYMRVDLYLAGDRIVVGELTTTHGAGRERWHPESFDVELGSWWTPPEEYPERFS